MIDLGAGFDTFTELVDFLWAELLVVAEEDTPTDGGSPANDDTSPDDVEEGLASE